MFPMAEPSTNLSPGSTSGSRAVRADENGAPSSTAQNSRVHNTGSESAGIGQDLRSPQAAELADREDFSVGGLLLRGAAVASRDVLPPGRGAWGDGSAGPFGMRS